MSEMAIVGERGPELFIPDENARTYTAEELQRIIDEWVWRHRRDL